MFCPNCGKDFKSKEVNFCPACGKNLSDFKDAELEKQNSQPIEKTVSKKLSQDHTLTKSKIANEVIDAIEKGYTPGGKSKPDKKLESTNHQSKLNKKESSIVTKKLPKQRKWGWGWIVVGGLLSYQINNFYKESLGDNRNILVIIGIPLSILIYVYLRNKVFINTKVDRQRSFVSGLISVFVGWSVIVLMAGLLKPSVFIDTSNYISFEMEKLTSVVSKFQKEDALLWEFFIYDPETENDVKNNIKIIDKSIPLYRSKDSVAAVLLNNIYISVLKLEKQHPNELKTNPQLSESISSIIDNLKIMASASQRNLSLLKDYYIAWLNNSDDIEELYNDYNKSELELEDIQQKYMNSISEFVNSINSRKK